MCAIRRRSVVRGTPSERAAAVTLPFASRSARAMSARADGASHTRSSPPSTAARVEHRAHVVSGDGRTRSARDQPLERVLELAHVARATGAARTPRPPHRRAAAAAAPWPVAIRASSAAHSGGMSSRRSRSGGIAIRITSSR